MVAGLYDLVKGLFKGETMFLASMVTAEIYLNQKPCGDSFMLKIHYGVDVLHQPVCHPILSYWVG